MYNRHGSELSFLLPGPLLQRGEGVESRLGSGFAIYVTRFANFQSAYGPIGAVIAFLAWLYFAHIAILYGAELTYAMRLEAHGIHELLDLPCGVPQQSPAEGERGGRRRAA